jgi:2-keto-3-deoxy-L-rhamnonate aldolase RhmA
MVNTSAEAEAAVRACRYFPLGNRSNAGVRGEWGEFKNYRDYLDAVNNGLVIVPMIETNQSLENLDAIASVPGVDVLLIGPSDLSIELGGPLDYQCDIYQRALDKIAAPPRSTASPPGCISSRPGWTRTFSSGRDSSSSPCHGAPGRRRGSRTLWPVSSANDGDAGGPANGRIAQLRR